MSKLKYFDGTNWNEVGGNIVGDTLPIGAIVPFGGWDAPTGWLICDGTLLNKTAYPELFNAIGYSFGGEEGGSTFGLPDLRGRVPVGEKDNDSDFDGMGVTGGEKTHTLTANEVPKFAFTVDHIAYGDNSFKGVTNVTHTLLSNQGSGNLDYEGAKGDGKGWQDKYEFGGGQPHNNLQPYQVVCYIIKAKQSAGLVANVSNVYSASQSDTYSCDFINKTTNYSATEQVVGKWVDGKPVYRKVISGITETEGTFDIETISTNVKQAIKVDGFVVVSPMNLPISYSNTGAPIYYFIDGNDFKIQVGNASFAGKSWYAIIEYLKTTD